MCTMCTIRVLGVLYMCTMCTVFVFYVYDMHWMCVLRVLCVRKLCVLDHHEHKLELVSFKWTVKYLIWKVPPPFCLYYVCNMYCVCVLGVLCIMCAMCTGFTMYVIYVPTISEYCVWLCVLCRLCGLCVICTICTVCVLYQLVLESQLPTLPVVVLASPLLQQNRLKQNNYQSIYLYAWTQTKCALLSRDIIFIHRSKLPTMIHKLGAFTLQNNHIYNDICT